MCSKWNDSWWWEFQHRRCTVCCAGCGGETARITRLWPGCWLVAASDSIRTPQRCFTWPGRRWKRSTAKEWMQADYHTWLASRYCCIVLAQLCCSTRRFWSRTTWNRPTGASSTGLRTSASPKWTGCCLMASAFSRPSWIRSSGLTTTWTWCHITSSRGWHTDPDRSSIVCCSKQALSVRVET